MNSRSLILLLMAATPMLRPQGDTIGIPVARLSFQVADAQQDKQDTRRVFENVILHTSMHIETI